MTGGAGALDQIDRLVARRLARLRAEAHRFVQQAGRLTFISEFLAVQNIPIDVYICPIAHGRKPLEPRAAGASGPVENDNACSSHRIQAPLYEISISPHSTALQHD